MVCPRFITANAYKREFEHFNGQLSQSIGDLNLRNTALTLHQQHGLSATQQTLLDQQARLLSQHTLQQQNMTDIMADLAALKDGLTQLPLERTEPEAAEACDETVPRQLDALHQLMSELMVDVVNQQVRLVDQGQVMLRQQQVEQRDITALLGQVSSFNSRWPVCLSDRLRLLALLSKYH